MKDEIPLDDGTIIKKNDQVKLNLYLKAGWHGLGVTWEAGIGTLGYDNKAFFLFGARFPII